MSVDVGVFVVLGDEVDVDWVVGCGYVVGVCIVGIVDVVVLGVGFVVRVEGGILGVVGVVVVVVVDGVSLVLVGVNDEFIVDGCIVVVFIVLVLVKRGSDFGVDGVGFLGVGMESG